MIAAALPEVYPGRVKLDDLLVERVVARARGDMPQTMGQLTRYLRVPAISCEREHHGDVARLAETLRDDLLTLGFQKAAVHRLDGALPLVVAEHCKAGPERPTMLVYGHFDLQPVRGEKWSTPPHEPTVVGERLDARGAADDMGGWVSHFAALQAWLAEVGELPLNVKLLLEGEEEIGSPNLERYMDAFPEAFEADLMVLTDCENPAVDVPGLTVSLRGLMELELRCDALASDVHSGLWGNMAPDSAFALVLLLARLVDERGRLRIGRQEVPQSFVRGAAGGPPSEQTISSGARLLEGVRPLPEDGRPAAEWLWRQPAVTILSTSFPPPGGEKNAIRAGASAVLSFRLAPGQTAAELEALIRAELLREPPAGVQVSLTARPGGASSWLYEPKGAVFHAVDRAYEKGFGRPMMQVGIGGSIPFVALFGRRFGHLPLVLNGVMDPETGAHGPNESMHLGVFEKAVMTNVHLVAELAGLSRGEVCGRKPASDAGSQG